MCCGDEEWQDRQCACNVSSEVRLCKHCCSGKAISITCSECVSVALVIQHALCTRHTAICSLPSSAIFFHSVSQTAQFWKKKKYRMCVLIFYTPFVWNIFHSKKNCQRYNHTFILLFMCSTCIILVTFKWSFSFLDKFPKNTPTSHFVGADLLHADRQTDMPEVTAAFNNLAKAPINVVWWTCTDVSDRHIASTFGPQYKNSALLHTPNHTVTESSKCHTILG